jgi:hypothetical protein
MYINKVFEVLPKSKQWSKYMVVVQKQDTIPVSKKQKKVFFLSTTPYPGGNRHLTRQSETLPPDHTDKKELSSFVKKTTSLYFQVQHKPLPTRFKHPDIPIMDQVDPSKSVHRPDHSSEHGRPSLCNAVLETLPMKEDTFHETALVSI